MNNSLFAVLLLACLGPPCMVVSGGEPDAAPIPDNPLADTAAPVPDNAMADTSGAEARREAIRQWREAKFGLFLHWGVYSVYGGTYKGKALWSAEWIQDNARIPWKEYAETAAGWNPAQFDAEAWILAAKSAGMKYIVITAKHHDGFAMFPSKASKYNLMDWTRYRGPDPLRALKDACRKHGLLFGVYYSPLEYRTSPDDWGTPPEDVANGTFSFKQLGPLPYASNADVVALAKAQIKEIAEWYRPDIFWFDGTWDRLGVWTQEDADEAAASIRAACPDVVINNRLGAGADFNTYEGKLPDAAPGGIWEYCWNLGCFWGYNPRNYEPQIVGKPEQYIETLVKTASLGGNYLLNVGPMPTGELPPVAVDYLKQIGAWATAHGECIYGVEASPYPRKPDWGYVTSRSDKLYLIVKDWSPKIVLPALNGQRPLKTRLMGGRERAGMDVIVDGDHWGVSLAGPKPTEPFAVVVLELAGSS